MVKNVNLDLGDAFEDLERAYRKNPSKKGMHRALSKYLCESDKGISKRESAICIHAYNLWIIG